MPLFYALQKPYGVDKRHTAGGMRVHRFKHEMNRDHWVELDVGTRMAVPEDDERVGRANEHEAWRDADDNMIPHDASGCMAE